MKSPVQPLDLSTTPLEAGSTLIEASAGTGKTYSVAGIVLRLLLEHQVDGLGNILVMTFTNAATAELIERIRQTLNDATALFSGAAGHTTDAFLSDMARAHRHDGLAVLTRALRDLDDLSVVTIHGFCHRMLEQHALETGTGFDIEYGADDGVLLARAAEDFWRRTVYPLGDLFAAATIYNNWTPTSFVADYRVCRRHPGIEILPPALSLDRAATELASAAKALCEAWDAESLREFFAAIKFNKSGRTWPREHPQRIEAAAAFVASQASALGAVLDLAPESLEGKLPKKKHREYTALPTVTAIANLADAVEACGHALCVAFIRGVDAIVAVHKRSDDAAHYDDLLSDLHAALLDPVRAPALKAAAGAQFQAVLVDEFQDTDTLQYDIFRLMFPGSRLFFVGDPKQSIYAFRGADVFAYLEAKHDADRQYTLLRNFRSDAPLVEAVNAVFRRRSVPFEFEDIPFVKAVAADTSDATAISGDERLPLEWLWLGNTPTKGEFGSAATRAVVAEISNLVGPDSRARLDGRRIRPGDIAVLVRTRYDGEPVRDRLEQERIPAVVSQADNVLESEDALELHTLLEAVLAPRNSHALRAALATRAFGYSATAIAALANQQGLWDELVETFDQLLNLWHRRGFITMAEDLLRLSGAREHLLACPDGARRLTNLLHLIELVQHAAEEHHTGPDGTLAWLAQARADATRFVGEATELRLETDSEAVQIITIHKSKGLEFPIVFCPNLVFDKVAKKNDAKLAHLNDGRVVYHFAPVADDVALAHARESDAENIRLAYVAFTRAKHRLYVVVASASNDAKAKPTNGSSAFIKLLQGDEQSPIRAALDALCSDHSTVMALREWATSGNEAMARQPAEADTSPLQARVFAPVASHRLAARRITSFSSLRTGRTVAAELPDYRDPEIDAATSPELPSGLFAFARGARAGTCLHEVIEHVDFAAVESRETESLVRNTLERHGLSSPDAHVATLEPVRVVCDLLRDLVAASLPSQSFTLAAIASGQRLTEWQFHLPVTGFSQSAVASAFANHAGPAADPGYVASLRALGDRAIEGFLGGYVDLVFVHDERWYVVDWKSNHLGNTFADYGEDAIVRSMREHHYLLQYHLYTVALSRYLAQRVPDYDYDRHFGGVGYAYLRGMRAGSSNGWFFDRPARALVEDLDGRMQGGATR